MLIYSYWSIANLFNDNLYTQDHDKNMIRFFLFILTIFSLVFIFLGFNLTGIGYYSWLISGFLVGTILLYPLAWYNVFSDKVEMVVRNMAYFNMVFVSMLIVLLLTRTVISLLFMSIKPDWSYLIFSQSVTMFFFALSIVLVLVGYINAKKGPQIISVDIPFADLPEELSGYTIAHISDLHAGPTINVKYVANVVDKVLSLNADVVVLTGDIADGSFNKYHDRVEPLSLLAKKSPALFVPGNHEYIKDGNAWLNHFKKLGIEVLLNEHRVLIKNTGKILFGGVIDPAGRSVVGVGPDLNKTLHNHPEVDLKILLAHQPNIAKQAHEFFDLQLSGHTHAGQFFPFNIAIKFVQPFVKGLEKYKGMWLYTNTGTGYWGPAMRLGTISEITHLRLVKQ